MNKPHVHAALIKQWADGAEIEVYHKNIGEWLHAVSPTWSTTYQYRVRPKPDVVRYFYVPVSAGLCSESATLMSFAGFKLSGDNVKATFCGETGALKGVELLK